MIKVLGKNLWIAVAVFVIFVSGVVFIESCTPKLPPKIDHLDTRLYGPGSCLTIQEHKLYCKK